MAFPSYKAKYLWILGNRKIKDVGGQELKDKMIYYHLMSSCRIVNNHNAPQWIMISTLAAYGKKN